MKAVTGSRHLTGAALHAAPPSVWVGDSTA